VHCWWPSVLYCLHHRPSDDSREVLCFTAVLFNCRRSSSQTAQWRPRKVYQRLSSRLDLKKLLRYSLISPIIFTEGRKSPTFGHHFQPQSPLTRCGFVMPKFHYIYLAQNLLKTRFSTRSPTCFELIDLSRHVEIDLSGLKQVRDFFGLWLICHMSATCSKHVGDLVENPVLSRLWAIMPHSNYRWFSCITNGICHLQDRCNGIWA